MKRVLLNRYVKLSIDAMVAGISLYLAFQIRFEGKVSQADQARLWAMLFPVAAARLFSLFLFRLWTQKWRYTTAEDALRIAAAAVPPTLALLVLRVAIPVERWFVLPLGVIAIEMLLSITLALGLRLFWRTLCERGFGAGAAGENRKLLLIGAGYHGAMIAGELARNRGVTVVGFLDDDPGKRGMTIGGRKVLGPIGSLEKCVDEYEVDDVLVCIPPGDRAGLNLKLTNGRAARVKFMPSVDDVLQSDWQPLPPARILPAPRSRPARARAAAAKSANPAPVRDKRILITGGAGFIGSSLAARLAPANELVLFDLTFRDKPIEFTGLVEAPGVKLVQGDILDEKLLAEISKDVDIVIHTAAVLGVSRVCSAARDTLETNYVGTARLLHALESNKRLERFVYFSTSEVFGINSYRVTEETPSSIGSSTEARWSYAIGKVAGEHLVRSYYRDSGTPVVIVRPFNIFGPRRTGDYALLRFIVNAIAGAPLEVHGDGSQIRAWCYIDDFCDAVNAMLERPQAVGEDFNIGNPANTVTIYELARRVIELAGSSSSIVLRENPYPDITIRVPCLAKSQRILDYDPRFDLDSGLTLTIDWYKDNWERFSQWVKSEPALVPTPR